MAHKKCTTIGGILIALFGLFPLIYSFTYAPRYRENITVQGWGIFVLATYTPAFLSGIIWIVTGLMIFSIGYMFPDVADEKKKAKEDGDESEKED
ncbi:hypothetical protein BLNAU_2615 [Blattamonas nauphoetae]|uniref:Uncharacterized protein n=1 Tax=Blattamonas nauphoetae TaxID=2049346 RepID=A0ABQ9YF19_9EUKA|nr:hypothetical protein BLNAU_2615 [Blattamonas nauphoetae]